MSSRRPTGRDVFAEAVLRLKSLYDEGHRLVVSFSAGKDSGVVLEVAIIASQMAGRGPVDVVLRDEEIMFPGTYEYALRVAERPEVNLVWLVANQPVVNNFNRVNPYFWVFDPELDPDEWVRKPPSWATYIKEQHIECMTIPDRFPPPPGKRLFSVVGMRVSESRGRFYGIRSMMGHIKKPNKYGVSNVWPIYDWGDSDIWKAIAENKWDYNSAYDVMNRFGVNKNRLRIAPPTMSVASADTLGMASCAWPQWFDKVAKRLPGVRAVAKFGRRALLPNRRLHETWEECFKRTCIDEAPEWIRDRSIEAMKKRIKEHSCHATYALPDVTPCRTCTGNLGCWKALATNMYLGDPFSIKQRDLRFVEPEFFRKGAGYWNGTPSF